MKRKYIAPLTNAVRIKPFQLMTGSPFDGEKMRMNGDVDEADADLAV